MRLSGLSLCLSVLYLPVMAQEYGQLPQQCDRRFYGLNGAVIRVEEKQWQPPLAALLYSTTTAFTPDSSYRLSSSREMVFDTAGRVLSLHLTEQDEKKKNTLQESNSYFYYRKVQLAAFSRKEKDKMDSVAFHYRKNGQMDYYSVFKDKGELQYKMTYVYKRGKVATLRKNDKGNMPVAMTKYKYTGDQLLETQHFDDQYRLAETRRYSAKQTKEGLLNESYSVTGPDGKMKSGASVVKDKQGMILEQNTINANREVTEYQSFAYNDQSQPVTEKVFSALEEATITNRYQYDDKGNWIKKEVFYNGALRSVFLRQLQYR